MEPQRVGPGKFKEVLALAAGGDDGLRSEIVGILACDVVLVRGRLRCVLEEQRLGALGRRCQQSTCRCEDGKVAGVMCLFA